MSDTSTALVNKSGAITVDMRLTPASTGIAPSLALVGGLTDTVELGVGGGIGFPYGGALNAGTVAPWVRGRFFNQGNTTLAVLAGPIVDFTAFARSQVGAELLLTQAFRWGSLDVNLGGGAIFEGIPWVGHLSACLNVLLRGSWTLVAEVFGYLNATGPSVGQRAGISWAPSARISFDASVAIVETPLAPQKVAYFPQVGSTVFF